MKTYETHLETLWKPCGKHPKACEKLSKTYANPVETNENSVNTYGKPGKCQKNMFVHNMKQPRVFFGQTITIKTWPEEPARKNMDPGQGETQSEATCCSKHNKNIDPQMENSRTSRGQVHGLKLIENL